MLAICISDFGINSYDFVSIYYLVELFLSKHVERFQKLSLCFVFALSCRCLKKLSLLVKLTAIFQSTAVFIWVSKSHWFCFAALHDWLKKLALLFNPIRSSHTFSRALRQPHEFSSSFDWFTEFSMSFVIGLSHFYETQLENRSKVQWWCTYL